MGRWGQTPQRMTRADEDNVFAEFERERIRQEQEQRHAAKWRRLYREANVFNSAQSLPDVPSVEGYDAIDDQGESGRPDVQEGGER